LGQETRDGKHSPPARRGSPHAALAMGSCNKLVKGERQDNVEILVRTKRVRGKTDRRAGCCSFKLRDRVLVFIKGPRSTDYDKELYAVDRWNADGSGGAGNSVTRGGEGKNGGLSRDRLFNCSLRGAGVKREHGRAQINLGKETK